MNILCDKALLVQAVSNVSRAVSGKTTLPALEGILMVAKGGQVQLTGYDLELGISTHLEAQVLEEGEIVLSAKLLLDRFEALNREGRATILMVTHDAFTASYCRRILFLQDGAVLTQLERGGQSRRAFFQQIIGVVTRLGGDQSDVL